MLCFHICNILEGNQVPRPGISCAHFNMELSFIILFFSGNVIRVPAGFRNDSFSHDPWTRYLDAHLLSYSSYSSVPTPATRVGQDYVKEGRKAWSPDRCKAGSRRNSSLWRVWGSDWKWELLVSRQYTSVFLSLLMISH